jgi:hypothetical protein
MSALFIDIAKLSAISKISHWRCKFRDLSPKQKRRVLDLVPEKVNRETLSAAITKVKGEGN